MSKELKPKEKEFISEYLSNGNNATQAVLKVWPDLKEESARSKGSFLLTNDNIREKLNSTISDSLLRKKHEKLLEQKRVEYFVFPKAMDEEEIVEKVNAAGFEVIVIRDGEKGKYAFYSIDDAQAISKAIDMGYKLKGSYAPEKSVNVNVNADIIPTERLKALADKIRDAQ
jgi:hypothetical protein